jgi:hypothetical protein
MRLLSVCILAFAWAVPLWSAAPIDTTWPQFRGHAGRGVSEIDKLPLRWSAKENVTWKVDVPGRGWSSPIVGHQVIVTSAMSPRTKAPSMGFSGTITRPS